MTLRERKNNKVLQKNNLRHRLQELPDGQQVVVTYKNEIVAIDYPKNLLTLASRKFMGLLGCPIVEEITGATIYLKI